MREPPEHRSIRLGLVRPTDRVLALPYFMKDCRFGIPQGLGSLNVGSATIKSLYPVFIELRTPSIIYAHRPITLTTLPQGGHDTEPIHIAHFLHNTTAVHRNVYMKLIYLTQQT